MALEDIADKVIGTDVFIVGGGMAGCRSAAKAKEYGLDVTIAEKAHTDGAPNRMAQNIIENRSLWVLEDLEKLGISSK
ncbi:MAG: FAD-binding protein [Deltaproteobacteria bacterium]|nr:FAD-binding protein [Deltaproteobacteria bacterium]